MDLELRCELATVKHNPDVLLADVKLERVDDRSLREHPNDILSYFTDNELIEELEKRDVGIYDSYKCEIENLEGEVSDLTSEVSDRRWNKRTWNQQQGFTKRNIWS